MRVFTRSAAALTGLILLASSFTTMTAAPAVAAPVSPEDKAIVEPADGTPRSIHTYEPGYDFETGGHPEEKLGQEVLGEGGAQPQDVPASLEPMQRQGAIKVKLVTVQLADNSSQISMANAVNAVNVSSSYWKSMSNNRLSMSVTSQVAGHKTKARSTWSYNEIMNQVTSELRWTYSPYSALVVFIPSALPGGILGYGWSSNGTSGRILMPQMSNFTTNVVTHEFGHVLGLMHADALQCGSGASDTGVTNGRFTDPTCYIREYGDTMDLMGSAQWFQTPVISASFWDYGKFGRGDEIRNTGVASGRKTYTLRPWAGTAANRAIKFTDPKSREVYYLEHRAPVGYDKALAVNGNFGVKITQLGGSAANASLILMPSTKPFAGYYAANHSWKAGSTFVTAAGTRVTINSVSTTAATVTVEVGGPFWDIGTSGFRGEIEWLYSKGLTTGYTDGTYRPLATMNRDAMAAFIYRHAGSPRYTPPTRSPFKDVPTNSQYYKEIAWMESVGLATGWDDGTYRPLTSINRDAMAAFLYRYTADACNLGGAAGFTAPTTSPFRDVPRGAEFYKEISWMKHSGVSTGYGDKTFRPLEGITREAMAAFVYRVDGVQKQLGGCKL
ncbi:MULTISPECIES: S-layer homology domain-containing protein [unclassified Arthrobacter]|uniref:S-layer homology domain-containing protein n=1 Tax=unclassified Arthrobacter TaxID=235627 RepID=UPI0014922FF3|nr:MULTISPECIES: S-layer homology domain-containing protein [unclassified Arthrobacter]MBE0010011.1 S-layer protein [Arthrobacter sp. AET 35A]NOJ58802.1 S-layer protein [Arthrobacter sp. 260]NOJ63816.1 S-layer protein [Arthrobacter sp. 147(2020)]